LKQLYLAVLASGNGTNAEEIFKYFKDHSSFSVQGLLTNNPKAHVIKRATRNNIPCRIFNREEFTNGGKILRTLQQWNIDAIILAGFLWLIPEYLIDQYQNRILNIHPALLPSFGGPGMYGMRVHKAVLEYGAKVSGVTVHLVDDEYDTGTPILQRCVPVLEGDIPETLAARVLAEEHKVFPEALQLFCENRIEVNGRKLVIKKVG